MKGIRIFFLFLLLMFTLFHCKKDDDTVDPGVNTSPVHYDLANMPYPQLSDYHFFEGNLKDLSPVYGVLPYEPITSLFTDYAHKKRFVWMPSGSKAEYQDDHSIFNFPNGSILIKNFYYENLLPQNERIIIETRLMIKKNNAWIFANYIWNDAQTEAFLDSDGANKNISFIENGQTYQTTYRIPNENECLTCHKSYNNPVPIGVKPQNLNKDYGYDGQFQNQLSKWRDMGYLNNYPTQIETVVDWQNPSENIEKRVRSYLDMNCAHCHTDGAHCEYTSMRFAYHETANPDHLGICVESEQYIPGYNFIIEAGNVNRSALAHRMSTNQVNIRMPQIGRSIVHQEALDLVDQWISSLTQDCN